MQYPILRVVYREHGNVRTMLSQAWSRGGAQGELAARHPNGELLGMQSVDSSGLTAEERATLDHWVEQARADSGDVETAGKAAALTRKRTAALTGS